MDATIELPATVTKNRETIERVVARSIQERSWLSACCKELRSYAAKSDLKVVEAYAKSAYDAAGAGHSGRWQG